MSRLRRIVASLFIAAYLLLTAFYLGRHAIGDSRGGPFAYFWTWDMFPNYPTESGRRWAIGETTDGSYVTLVPNGRHRFRWGVHNDVTRFDINHRLSFMRQATVDAISNFNAQTPDDPIRSVYLADSYWPQKYNLPDDLYRDFYRDDVTGNTYWTTPSTNDGNSQSRYWRLVDEAEVDADGDVSAWEPSP